MIALIIGHKCRHGIIVDHVLYLKDDTFTVICKYQSKLILNSPWKSTTVTICRPDNRQNRCGTEEECECEELRLRRGLPLVCRVMWSHKPDSLKSYDVNWSYDVNSHCSTGYNKNC